MIGVFIVFLYKYGLYVDVDAYLMVWITFDYEENGAWDRDEPKG